MAAMDLTRQTTRAADIHTRYLLSGKATCIDCHKGIAHELPNMEGIDPGWKVPAELQGKTAFHGWADGDRLAAYLESSRMAAAE
jgi:cytochrome c-type protein NapC